jgi:hypothetical protein
LVCRVAIAPSVPLQIRDNLWIMGGADGSNLLRDGTALNDVYCFHLPTRTWTSILDRTHFPCSSTACVIPNDAVLLFSRLQSPCPTACNGVTLRSRSLTRSSCSAVDCQCRINWLCLTRWLECGRRRHEKKRRTVCRNPQLVLTAPPLSAVALLTSLVAGMVTQSVRLFASRPMCRRVQVLCRRRAVVFGT